MTEKTVTFEDIQSANNQIKTTEIKKKQYAEVHERVKAFRILYPQGFIKTELISDDGNKCVMRATVGFYENNEPFVIGEGTAYELKDDKSSFVNSTAYIENCETSAVGRALGMAGIGIDTAIASAEEIQKSDTTEGDKLPIDDHTIMVIENLCEETSTDISRILAAYKIKSLNELNMGKAKKIIGRLNTTRLNKYD